MSAGDPTSADLRAQFDDFARLTVEARTVTCSRILAGLTVEAAAADPDLLELFWRPMRHLPSGVAEPELVISLAWRTELAGRVAWRWQWQRQLYGDDRYEFIAFPWVGCLLARDKATNGAVLVVDPAMRDRFDRPESARPVVEVLLASRGLISVHGGTLGDGRHCVLLAARGGSGKSSLVAEGVAQGLRTIGDDFLFLRPGADPVLHSAYATVKLAPTSPAARLIDTEVDVVDGKRLGWLPDIDPDAMVLEQRPTALVVPSVGPAIDIQRADERAALTALLPTSALLSSGRVRTVQALTALTRSLPCWRLTVAGDADAELAALASVLTHPAGPGTAT